jgi:hypothetical protein
MTEQTVTGHLRPLGIGEILDGAVKLVTRNLRTLVLAVLALSVPIALLTFLITVGTSEPCTTASCEASFAGRTAEDDGLYVAGQLVNGVLAVLLYVLSQLVCFHAVTESYFGRRASVGETLRFAVSRSGATLWLFILLAVGLLVAFVLFILPGIWLAVAWAVAVPALLVERLGGAAALRRSFQLVRGRWWASFALFVVALLLIFVVTIVLSLAVAALLFFIEDGSNLALALESAVNVLANLLTAPFLAAVVVLLYFDLRVRKEGFDLALLAEEMGGERALAPRQHGRGDAPHDPGDARPSDGAESWRHGGFVPPGADGGTDPFGRPRPEAPGSRGT